MAAIAHSLFLAMSLSMVLSAASTPRDAVTTMAEDLSAENPSGFIRALAPAMEGYVELRENIESLDAAYDASSSIEILEEKEASVLVDWYLELKPKSGVGQLIRRRERIRLDFQRKGKRLQVIRLQPISFFSPR